MDRYVDGTPTSKVTPVTIRYTHPPQNGHTSQCHVMNRCLTSFSFNVHRPSHSWDNAISDSDLETPRSRSWAWSKGPVSYKLASFSFHINPSNNPWGTPISKFDFETSKVKVMSEVKRCQGHILYPLSKRCISFVSHQSEQPPEMSIRVFDLEKTHPKFIRKFPKITVWNKKSPKCNQIINMTRSIKLLCFVVISWVVLTLSCRQANFRYSIPQPWPWVEVMERSSSTFPQIHIFFVPYI